MSPLAATPPPALSTVDHLVDHLSDHLIDSADSPAAPHGWRIHQVGRGETLSSIAVTYRTTVRALAQHNRIADPDRIAAGTRLAVPRTSAVPASKHSAAPAKSAAHHPAAARLTQVRVAAGDTLSDIAVRLHSTVGGILAANHGLDPDRLLIGSSIAVPVAAAPAHHASSVARSAAPARHIVHVRVARGDTVSTIALRRHSSIAAILKANHGLDPRRLAVGSVIAVPVAGPATASRSTAGRSTAGSSTAGRSTAARTFAGRTYAEEVVRAAEANRVRLTHAVVPTRSQIHDLIVATARRNGVDPRLALAIGWQESGWNQRAVSVADAIGAMQVLPGTGEWAGQLAGRSLNLLDAKDNITAGVLVLRYLTAHAHDQKQAIAGYYQGLGGVQEHGMYPDTKAYVRSVRALMTTLS